MVRGRARTRRGMRWMRVRSCSFVGGVEARAVTRVGARGSIASRARDPRRCARDGGSKRVETRWMAWTAR